MINKKWLQVDTSKKATRRYNEEERRLGHSRVTAYSVFGEYNSMVEEGKVFKSPKDFIAFKRNKLNEQK